MFWCALSTPPTLLALCTIDWFQDGRAWVTECSNFLLPTISSQVHYLSLFLSSLNLTTNKNNNLTVKLSLLISRHHQDPDIPIVHVNHRQHICLGLCLAHNNTRDELEIHLHTRNFTVVLDLLVAITFLLGRKFRTREQLASESSCEPLSWPCLADPQDLNGTGLVPSLWTISVSKSPTSLMFHIFTLTPAS